MTSTKTIRLVNITEKPKKKRNNLAPGSKIFLASVRSWAANRSQGQCVKKGLIPLYVNFGCVEILSSFDQVMVQLSSSAFRPIEVKCSHSVELSDDEDTIVQALQVIALGNFDKSHVLLADIIPPRLIYSVIRVIREFALGLKDLGFPCGFVQKLQLVENS